MLYGIVRAADGLQRVSLMAGLSAARQILPGLKVFNKVGVLDLAIIGHIWNKSLSPDYALYVKYRSLIMPYM